MKKILTASTVAILAFAVVASAATFSANLTVGSRGADVTALQTALIAGGYSIPAGATGYFGSQTKAAVQKYQAAKGVPATGFVGPLTRAALNGGVAVAPVAAGCPAGYTCTPVAGAVTPVSTVGLEGTLTVDQGAISNTTVYEGNVNVPVLSLRLRALTSDITVKRVSINLGTSTTIVTKAFNGLSLVADNGQVIASYPLNLNNIVKLSDGNYYAQITGFSYVVPANTYRYLSITANVNSSVDTTYRHAYTFTVPVQGVRGVDGAGVDQYSPATAIPQAVTIATSLVDSASLTVSTNQSTPAIGAVIANSGANNDEADKVTALVFDLKAKKDAIGVTDISASTTISTGSITSAYLYDGSTLVANVAVSANGTAAFTNIGGTTGYVIAADTTKTFTIKVDIRSASTTPGSLNASIGSGFIIASAVKAQNSQGLGITPTGSATANTLSVTKAGPVFTLVGTPTITKSVIGTSASSTFATSFTFTLSAQGTDVSVAAADAVVIGIYVNNGRVATTSAIYDKPTSGVSGSGPYVVADGSTATFTAQTAFTGPNGVYVPAGGLVSARVESINGVTYVADTFRTTGNVTL
ncbi:MAG: peptidoglycan-binding domain-containing protein [Candidatus Taylorbacteria bacterium]